MYGIDEIKKRAKGKTSLIIFACIVVVAVLFNWLTGSQIMFGFPAEIITMLLSTVGGAVMKMWSQSNADKAEQQKALISRFKASEDSVANANGVSIERRNIFWPSGNMCGPQ